MSFDSKLFAFLSLLVVQVVVSVIYKFSQTKGKYTYSPLSAIASAEFIKLCMSCSFFIYNNVTNWTMADLSACLQLIKQQVQIQFVFYTFGLALLYVINNQLAFVLYLYVDMASIAMFKSLSTIISAILLWTYFDRLITREQWSTIVLQVIGLLIVQYDSCQNLPLLAFKHYFILIGSTFITSVCSVLNEHLIKTYSVDLHIQNLILYSCGLSLNLFLFFFLPDLFVQSDVKQGFFQGYSLSVIGIILCNSVLGLVITFVYKYADVIVKTFSTACATGVLLYINVAFFNIKTNLTVFLGAIVVFIASYLFLLVKPATPTNVSDDADANANNKIKTIWTKKHAYQCVFFSFLIGSSILYITVTSSPNKTFLHRLTDKSALIITGIEPNYINHSVAIHGINLCTNQTLNDTRILVNSHVCSPIDYCSNTTVSCYISNILNNHSFYEILNINFTTQHQQATFSTANRISKSSTYWQKKNIALVVHFNKPYYERIPILRIYNKLFPFVVFTGHQPDPNVIHCPGKPDGIRIYECLARAVSLHPNYDGYLFTHFDLLPIFDRLESKNLMSFWLPEIGCIPRAKLDGWWWWSQDSGAYPLTKALDEIDNNKDNQTFHQRYAANYRKHANEKFCQTYSDLFYLPQRFTKDYIVLSNHFGKHGVFHEIAIPTMTYLIISTNLSQNIDTIKGIHFGMSFSLKLLDEQPSLQFFHRLELSQYNQTLFIKEIVNRSISLLEK